MNRFIKCYIAGTWFLGSFKMFGKAYDKYDQNKTDAIYFSSSDATLILLSPIVLPGAVASVFYKNAKKRN